MVCTNLTCYDFTWYFKGKVNFSITASSEKEMQKKLEERVKHINVGEVDIDEPSEDSIEYDEYDCDNEPMTRYEFTIPIEGHTDFTITASSWDEATDELEDHMHHMDLGEIKVDQPTEEPCCTYESYYSEDDD